MVTRSWDVLEPSPTPAREAMGTGLFAGKLRVPSTAHNSVVRARLHQRLDDGVDAGAVIVSGPPGSGKTQLVTTWLPRQRTPREVAWLTLDVGDADPARFMKYVVGAVGATSVGRRALRSMVGIPPPPTVTESYLLVVSEALAALSAEVVLVLDDFQTVVGSASEQLLRRIVRYPPERMRLVLLTRVEPSLGQTKLRLQGSLIELGPDELAFTDEEAAELMRAHGLTMNAGDVAALQARTSGWAAGLGVMAASLVSGAARTSTIAPGGDQALLDDYLMFEVFDRQPPEIQSFLLQTTVTNPICGSLADSLTVGVRGDLTLAELCRDHIFLDRAGETPPRPCTWYRWNPIFAELLHRRLDAIDPDLPATLHRRAARWFRLHDAPVEAIRQALAGNDDETAITILGESWLDLVVSGESAVVHELLASFDEPARSSNPELTAACAFVGMQDRDVEWASRCADRAALLAGALPPTRRRAVRIVSTVVLLHVATMIGGDRDVELLERGRSLVRELGAPGEFLDEADRRRRALLLYHLGTFEVSRWMYDEPHQHLDDALAAAGTLDMPELVLRARAQLAFLDFLSGRLGRAETTALEIVETAAARGWHSTHGLAIAHLVLGGVDLLRGELARGLQRLELARHVAHPVDLVNQFRIAFTTHATLRVTGPSAALVSAWDALRSTVERWDSPPEWVQFLMHLAEAERLADAGDADAALAVIESLPDVRLHRVLDRHRRVFHAYVLLRGGRPDDARTVLTPLIETAASWPADVGALVLDALAADALGLHEAASGSAAKALELADADRMLEPFLAAGPPIDALIRRVLDQGTPHETFALEVLRRLASSQQGGTPTSTSYVEALTSRELEVLGQMQGTASYEQIARRLFVSLNTLKTHMKHIHRKLGTTSRREAVARARELGIL